MFYGEELSDSKPATHLERCPGLGHMGKACLTSQELQLRGQTHIGEEEAGPRSPQALTSSHVGSEADRAAFMAPHYLLSLQYLRTAKGDG